MRIGLDVRYLSHGLTGGVRTYVYRLAWHLPRLAPDDEFVCYADGKAPFELTGQPANVTVATLPWISPLSSIVNDMRLARRMDRDRVDVAHYRANYGSKGRQPLVVTVHDALNLFPMSQHLRGFGRRPRQVAMMAYLGWRTRKALRESDAVITISDHARFDIAARSGCPLARIHRICEAAGEEYREIADIARLEEGRKRCGITGRAILADGIKNPRAVIDAHGRLPEDLRQATSLVFFSREASPRLAVAAVLNVPGVLFVPRPTTAELVLLMNLATVFVFPSWYEGFGLPVLEAMQCGAPVIASSRGSIPEVLGGAGLLFDVEVPGQLAEHLKAILSSDLLLRELRARSHTRAAEFDWGTTARQTLDVYCEVVARRRGVACR